MTVQSSSVHTTLENKGNRVLGLCTVYEVLSTTAHFWWLTRNLNLRLQENFCRFFTYGSTHREEKTVQQVSFLHLTGSNETNCMCDNMFAASLVGNITLQDRRMRCFDKSNEPHGDECSGHYLNVWVVLEISEVLYLPHFRN